MDKVQKKKDFVMVNSFLSGIAVTLKAFSLCYQNVRNTKYFH
jgi:hypothetical protein